MRDFAYMPAMVWACPAGLPPGRRRRAFPRLTNPGAHVIITAILREEAGDMAEYGRDILVGAACAQMATLLVDICGFSADMAVYGIAMPISSPKAPR